jgi:hypothetical protein
VNVYAFVVPNPYGVCASGRVATFAENRTAALRKIKTAGLKVSRSAVASPVKLKATDLTAIENDRETVWIRGVGLSVNGSFVDDDPWRPVDRFRELYA